MNDDLKSEDFDFKREFTFFELVNRYYKYGNWITNISMSLLGFYIAVLFHYKSIEYNIVGGLSIPAILLIIASVVIGIILKIKYDVKYKHDVIYKNFRKLIDEKKVKTVDFFNEMRNVFNHNPKPFVRAQFVLVCLSLLFISADLIRYFFFT
jgi:uncharacterized integral membrane protein